MSEFQLSCNFQLCFILSIHFNSLECGSTSEYRILVYSLASTDQLAQQLFSVRPFVNQLTVLRSMTLSQPVIGILLPYQCGLRQFQLPYIPVHIPLAPVCAFTSNCLNDFYY